MVDVGADNPVCMSMTEYEAYLKSAPQLGTVNVTPKAQDAWTTWAIYGGLALLAFALLKGR